MPESFFIIDLDTAEVIKTQDRNYAQHYVDAETYLVINITTNKVWRTETEEIEISYA